MKTKEEIYDGALKIILERGYDNAPISLIAKELKLSKGGLFHYFSSKEQLLYEIIKYNMEKDFFPIIKETKKIKDPRERLAFFINQYIALLTKEPVAVVAIHEARRLSPAHLNEIRKIWRELLDLISGAITELKKSGKAKNINSTFSAFSLIGMCSWLFYWFDYSRKDSVKELEQVFDEIFFSGLLK